MHVYIYESHNFHQYRYFVVNNFTFIEKKLNKILLYNPVPYSQLLVRATSIVTNETSPTNSDKKGVKET